GPVLVAERAIRADAQHLGTGGLEVASAPVEGRHARASPRRPVERVEEDHDVSTAVVPELHLREPDRLEGEVRRGVSDAQGLGRGGRAHGPVPPRAYLTGGFRATIARPVAVIRAGGLRWPAHRMWRRPSRPATGVPT